MIEIALCLAIIGFGLVAIIGVLPTGLNVQRDNRQETIIDQDAAVWMDAIRNGSFGYDDLTNYVISITNYWTQFTSNGLPSAGTDYYTSRLAQFYGMGYGSRVTSVGSVANDAFALDNGARVVGLLSTPKYIPIADGGFQSNYVVAIVRAISGAAVEKIPQNDPTILQDGFRYRMVAEVASYVPFNSYALDASLNPANEALARLRVVNLLQANSHDLRLLFRWPILPTGEAGNGRQTFRVLAAGRLIRTNEFLQPNQPLFFLQPSIYTHVP
jgi:hypothetical protein